MIKKERRWRWKVKKKNNLFLSKKVFLSIILICLPVSYFMDIGFNYISEEGVGVAGINFKWSEGGRVRVVVPFERRSKNGEITEWGTGIFHVTPKLFSSMPVEHEIRRNKEGRTMVERGRNDYFSTENGEVVLRRDGTKSTLKSHGDKWEAEHEREDKKNKQDIFLEKNIVIIQDK